MENDNNENAKHIYEKFDFTEIIDRGEETVKGRTYQYNLLLRKSNTKKLEKLVRKFDLGSKIIKATQIHGGLSNRMYRVETDKAEYAIKKLNKTLMQNKEEFERINFAEKVSKIAEENGISVVRALEFENKIINNENKNKKIAIVGGGPAGLTASAFLLKKGYSVTIFEKYDYLGGLLVHGIPEFRLPKKIVKDTIQKILNLGLQVEYNKELGKNFTLQELEDKFDAVFLAYGANITTKMGVDGENLQGVFGGNQLLEKKLHPNYQGKKVAVIGGGNVAMDCARTIKRLGAEEVDVIYRRAEEQMPAEAKEIEEAKQEGIKFLFQNNIVKIVGNQKVEKLELIKTELVQKEGEKRKVPINIENSNYLIDIDYVIMALGSMPEQFTNNLELDLDKYGYIIVDEKNRTSKAKIFAGGDIAGCKGTVAWAARSGKDAANSIDEYLKNI